MTISYFKKIILVLATSFVTSLLQAGTPMWTFTTVADYPPSATVAVNEIKIVKYTVTNQSNKTRTLMIQPIAAGVQQIASGAGVCTNPFILSSGGSCTLVLKVSGSQLHHSIIGGPTVCPQGPNGEPSKFQCYTPSKNDSLNIIINSPRLTLRAVPSSKLTVGLPYSQANFASGGTRPYTYKVSAGIVPAVTELLSDGTVYGIIRTPGLFAYIITVTDAKGATASAESSGVIIQSTADTNFPYGAAPQGNVCIGEEDFYATPETMLGSWAMQQAVELDHHAGDLPDFLYNAGVVYAVGTASLGTELGIPNCEFGCSEINGYCFAIQFVNDTSLHKPYMIFQSVDTAALKNSFDIYLAGGGCGAFPASFCNTFWGVTDGSVDWDSSIQNTSPIHGDCAQYFDNFRSINSSYSVIFDGIEHAANRTLIDSCNFAFDSGYNRKNFSNLRVVPVTCPTALTQITGIKQNSSVTTIGTKTIQPLSSITSETAFTTYNVADTCVCPVSAPCDQCTSTTQMQDCKTPSAGYCHTITPGTTVPNYEASISATLENPLLVKLPPSINYCSNNPAFTGGYCSWDDGRSNGDPDFEYCSQSAANCTGTGNDGCSKITQAQWCVCQPGGTLATCSS